ncbi:putative UDP-N-acetylglucosamine-peptide N-acetylglucosaminyltransferase SEC-like protein, partial [Trifolium pratense]
VDAHSNLGNLMKAQGLVQECNTTYLKLDFVIPQPAAKASPVSLWLSFSKMFSSTMLVTLILVDHIDVRAKTPRFSSSLRQLSSGIPEMENTHMSSLGHILLSPLPFIPDKMAVCWPGSLEVRYRYEVVVFKAWTQMMAYSCYLEALRIQPTFAIAWSNLAGLFMESGDFNRALQYYKEAVKLKPSFPDAYLNLGNVYKALRMPQEAIACYQHALQTRPNYGMAYEL